MCRPLTATNLTAGTLYEVAVWAHTSIGDSPTALSHYETGGTQPDRPLLKARALNQTAVDCSWTISGPLPQVLHALNKNNEIVKRMKDILKLHHQTGKYM